MSERPLNPKQIEAVLALPGPKRYAHFIKVVADSEKAWGLYDDGWALAESDAGEPIFLLWPAKDYAALCATGDWSGYSPEELDIEDLFD